MFHSLTYQVTFPSTGRTLKADLTFDRGFHAITGDNESGKTMILEMLRFGLFGTAALRGRADDYKTLQMTCDFTVRDQRYTVERTTKKAELKRAGEIVASGTTAVNEKIVQLFGFGLAIFDMACSINQGEVERLGSMKAGERKRLVDGVLGIDALDLVAKWGMEEARLLDKEAETIRARLVAPVQPEQPQGYQPTETIDLPALRAQAQELAEIEGFLASPRPKPVAPTCSVDLPAENLKGFAEKRRALREEVASLEAHIAALPSTVTWNACQLLGAEGDWARVDLYQQAQAWLRANPMPSISLMDAHEQLSRWEEINVWGNYDQMVAHKERIQAQIDAADKVDCPSCGHSFALHQQHVDELKAQLIDIPVPDFPRPERPTLNSDALQSIIDSWDTFDEAKHREMSAVQQEREPNIPRHLIPTFRAQIDQVAERSQLVEQLAGKKVQFDKMPDYEAMLAQREAYEAALPVYREQLEAWEAWAEQIRLKELRRTALAGAGMRLVQAEAAHTVSAAYEAAMTRFGADYDVYSRDVAAAEAAAEEAKEYRMVRDVMNVLRSLIKQHLMPSLNRVASHLLTQMTGGQRSAIYVDEDFNVVVDRQDLDTLSGSGKACANLALRIALGQVLTNRVFSVLLADEIDASMDDFRAENTAEVLLTLENSISQVLQVSHKSIEASNHIDLGALSDPQRNAVS